MTHFLLKLDHFHRCFVQVDDTKAVVDTGTLDVRCTTSEGKDNDNLRSAISTAVNRLNDTLNPAPLEKDE